MSFDAPAGLVLEVAGDREGGEDDVEVGFDGVAGVVEDWAGVEVGFGHSKALLDSSEVVVGGDHLCAGHLVWWDVGDVAFQSGEADGLVVKRCGRSWWPGRWF